MKIDLTKTVFLEVGPPGSRTLYYQYTHLEKKYKMCMHNSSKKELPPQFNDASTRLLLYKYGPHYQNSESTQQFSSMSGSPKKECNEEPDMQKANLVALRIELRTFSENYSREFVNEKS